MVYIPKGHPCARGDQYEPSTVVTTISFQNLLGPSRAHSDLSFTPFTPGLLGEMVVSRAKYIVRARSSGK